MSEAERRAFEEGAFYDAGESMEEDALEKVRAEALRRYPDKPCRNVREIVVEKLKEMGCDGLCSPGSGWGCVCTLARLSREENHCCDYILNCLPGVLRDGKIVKKEGE